MATMFWLAVFGFVVCAVGIVWYTARRLKERQRAEEERVASFLAATTGKASPTDIPATLPTAPPTPITPPALPAAGNGLAIQKLLFESAHKAGEAGEPALALQLYARLLARFPHSAFAEQARKAAEAQKRKLAKA